MDGEDRGVVCSRGGDGDGGAGRGVTAGVGEQVGDDLMQALLVADHDDRFGRQVEFPMVAGGNDAGVGDRVEGEPGQVDRAAVERPAGVQAGEQQEVFDQRRHASGLDHDLSHGVPVELGIALAEAQLCVAVDRGERRPQLVGGVRDELPDLLLAAVPRVEGVLHVPEQRVQRDRDLADLGAFVRQLIRHPRGHPDLAGVERQTGHLTGGLRDPAQRPQLTSYAH